MVSGPEGVLGAKTAANAATKIAAAEMGPEPESAPETTPEAQPAAVEGRVVDAGALRAWARERSARLRALAGAL